MLETFKTKINNGQRTKWSILFLVALLIYEISAGLEMTMLGTSAVYLKIGDVLKIAAIVILLVGAVIHIKYYSLSQWICFGMLGIISAICTYTSRSAAPILVFVFWLNMAEVELDDILRVYLVVITAIFVFAVLMYLLGVFPDVVLEGDDHGIGFTHSNTAAAAQFCIVLAYMTLRYGKLKWYDWIIMAAFAGAIYWLTGSRCMLIASVLAIALGLVINCFKSVAVGKTVGIISIVACPVYWIASYVMAMAYSQKISALARINQLLKGRLAWSALGVHDMGISMMGQQILWSTGKEINPVTGELIPYNIVDSSYISIMISYGWIYAIVLMLLYTAFAIYIYKRQKWNWSAAIFVVLTCGLVEGTLITIVCNPVLIAIGVVFFVKYFAKKTEVIR